MRYIGLFLFLVLFISPGTLFSQNENIRSYPIVLSYKQQPKGEDIIKIENVTEISFKTNKIIIPDKKVEMPYDNVYSVSIPTVRNPVSPILKGSLFGVLAGFITSFATHWPMKQETGSMYIYSGLGSLVGGAIGYFFGSKYSGYREYSLEGLNKYDIQFKIKDALKRNAVQK